MKKYQKMLTLHALLNFNTVRYLKQYGPHIIISHLWYPHDILLLMDILESQVASYSHITYAEKRHDEMIYGGHKLQPSRYKWQSLRRENHESINSLLMMPKFKKVRFVCGTWGNNFNKINEANNLICLKRKRII